MELEQIKTVLRVMNLTAPFDMVWTAQDAPSESWFREMYGIEGQLRFYLVPDDSPLLNEKGVIRA